MREPVPYRECVLGRWGKDCSKQCDVFCSRCHRFSGLCESDEQAQEEALRSRSSSPLLDAFFVPAAPSPLFKGCPPDGFFFHCYDCDEATDLPIMAFGHSFFPSELSAQMIPQPLAQRYFGRQFLEPENVLLGDGRSLSYFFSDGRVKNTKGTGKTIFSRAGGDGRATFASLCYEYLILIAISSLGILATKPTALLMSTCPFDSVVRDVLYDGSYQLFASGVLMREAPLASSPFLRLGTVSSASDASLLAPILFPDVCGVPHLSSEGTAASRARCLVKNVIERNAVAAARWQAAGFVHGTLNSDNIGLLGEVIDTTLSSFVSRYDLNFSPNFLDDGESKIYSLGEQARTLTWRLESLALDASVSGLDVADEFNKIYIPELHRLFDEKLGLASTSATLEGLYSSLEDYHHPMYGFLKWIEKSGADYQAAMYLIPGALFLPHGENEQEVRRFASHVSTSCFADPSHESLLSLWIQGVYLSFTENEKMRARTESSSGANPAIVFRQKVATDVCYNLEFAGSEEDRNDAKETFGRMVGLLSSPFQEVAEEGGRGNGIVEHLRVMAARKGGEVHGDHMIRSCGGQ